MNLINLMNLLLKLLNNIFRGESNLGHANFTNRFI